MKTKTLRSLRLCVRLLLCVSAVLLFAAAPGYAMTEEAAHQKFIYPVVRVTTNQTGGSGTVIYSKGGSTYVLTNHHVIQAAVKIEEEWNPALAKMVKKEKRAIVYVEVFQYRNLSTPVGTLKVEAEIELYNKTEDLALVKLRSDDDLRYVAPLRPRDAIDEVHVMERTVAVGCSLLFPPLPTPGILTRLNFQIDSLPYHMSSSQIIYGNSGGAMFLAGTGELIGVPSLVPVVGWGTPVTHMGLFIPVERIYDWLEREGYEFLYDPEKTEQECLDAREKRIEQEKKNGGK